MSKYFPVLTNNVAPRSDIMPCIYNNKPLGIYKIAALCNDVRKHFAYGGKILIF